MKKYPFRQCSLTKLDDLFGLQQSFTSTRLDDWLGDDVALSGEEADMVKWFQNLLFLNRSSWSDRELSLHFIGPMFSVANFTEPYRFNFFAERRISATITGLENEVELSGEPDGIVATGYREPKVPFFAFTEYKKQLDNEGDPAGQTLAAMLAGRSLNADQNPLYGAYVVGSDWYFMTLEGSQYSISRDYSALSDEIFDILRILKAFKKIVYKLTE